MPIFKDNSNMIDKVVILGNDVNLKDYGIKGSPKGTRIIMRDHDSGKILGEYHNKVVVSGAQMTACKQFGISPAIMFPTYNDEFNLDGTIDKDVDQPYNPPIVCLWCVGNDGCGTLPSDVYPVKYTSRLEPENMLPFRYVSEDNDLNDDMRKYYFGRYTDEDGMIRYMFKTFDTEPQLHLRYLDGTQLTDNLYTVDSEQAAECYVEVRLRVTRLDFRDYFEKVIGWDSAFINTLSLCFAWYDDTQDDYIYYQHIIPFTKLNFPNEYLVDLTKAIDFNYQVYY